jgi:hypothetical protein
MSLKRQQIIDSIIARFGEIKIANGYHTDFNYVSEFPTISIDESKRPSISIRDTTNINSQEWAGNPAQIDWELSVAIEIGCAGAETRATIRKMIADIYKAIGEDYTWGSYAIKTDLVGDEIVVKQDETQIDGAIINIKILYRTTKFEEN